MNQMSAINQLIDKGWISLRQLGVLLESPSRSIYGRQRTKNPVATIRIGGIERVYLESVKTELEMQGRIVLLQVIETGLHNKERKEKKNA